ncbi:DNA adenine methylase [Ralstonia solanacearum]|uniref:DNA adenine methylase n=1 Tax=Ralstonia solanacearum TaxID=305 RepID=UPI0018D15D10|nr:Dam family site-specific DNA-(adenine-N6)-methyltransferase [Ralstonia solanacearum]
MHIEENNIAVQGVTPFLKWAGGKRWLAETCLELFPKKFNTYIEPFLGGGAMFFRLMPERAVLADMNRELIETYSAIASDHRAVSRKIKKYHDLHSFDRYYEIRAEVPKKTVDVAARFIYLNRTCWNGLYRVNRKGQFNVPIGTKTNVVLDSDDWPAISGALGKAKLYVSDFEPIVDRASNGDLVFADPPYTVKHNNNGFVKYNENIFAWNDQIRLRDALLRAKMRGAFVFCTNADHQSIWELYRDDFSIVRVNRSSVISGKSQYRGATSELLIYS